jgi:hypothetical protein
MLDNVFSRRAPAAKPGDLVGIEDREGLTQGAHVELAFLTLVKESH